MDLWFSEMARRGLIFHPEEPADSLVRVDDGKPFFSRGEARKAQLLVDGFYARFSHEQVTESCYPHFMRAAGFQP